MKSSSGRSPWPGKLRKCRLQDRSPCRAAARRPSAPGRCGRAGSSAMALQIGLARQRVEAVEHQADGRVVGAAHRLPGVAIVVDVAAPGERLEADAQAALGRPLAELVEIGRGAVDAAEAVGRDVASTPAAGRSRAPASGRTCARRARRRASRCRPACPRNRGTAGSAMMFEPEVADQLAHVGGRAVERQQVVLEDLDALETCRRDRLELLGEAAAQRDRGDRQSSWLRPLLIRYAAAAAPASRAATRLGEARCACARHPA